MANPIEESIFNSEDLPYPTYINFLQSNATMSYGVGSFIKNYLDSNIEIIIPIGTALTPSIWYSDNVYLNTGALNSITNSELVNFINQKDVQVLDNITLYHNILIQYKLTKPGGVNFFNSRNIRCSLVNSGNIIYNNNITANQQPDTGQHDNILISGAINHSINDIVKLQFYIAQDNLQSDQSDTLITIFRINWNISGLINQ